MKILWNILTTMAAVAAITCCGQSGWSAAENELISCDGATMRVLTVYDAADSLVLRKECGTISEKELKSHEYQHSFVVTFGQHTVQCMSKLMKHGFHLIQSQ